MAEVFEPLSIRGLQLKNKILKAATHDGGTFEEFRSAYRRLAFNDVALITVAYVAVSPCNKTFDNQHHIGPDNADDWRELCRSVHEAGSKISAQLHHPGLFTMSSSGTPMGPSFFVLPSRPAWPRTMDLEAVLAVKREFVAAAALCKEVGFDCIELHCGHGYLLSQFLTPVINRRSDAYGGSAEKRARFPAEITEEIRASVGDSFPILVKLNAEDGLPIPGGMKVEDSLVAARVLAAAGADAIIPSFGYTSLNGFGMLRGSVPLDQMGTAAPDGSKWIVKFFGPYIVPKIDFEPMFLRDYGQRFLRVLEGTGCKVIYVGGADSFQDITDLLSDGFAAVQLGRPLIREPFYVKRLRKGLEEATDVAAVDVSSRCVRCNRCTLASFPGGKFQSGCVFLRPGEGQDIEDMGWVEAAPRL